MTRTLSLLAAWSAFICIAAVTLAPIGLRPMVTAEPGYERFAAYMVMGILFSVAYPRRIPAVIGIVVGAAVVLEALQHLTASRHGQWIDIVQKATGGLLGIAIGTIALRSWPRTFDR